MGKFYEEGQSMVRMGRVGLVTLELRPEAVALQIILGKVTDI